MLFYGAHKTSGQASWMAEQKERQKEILPETTDLLSSHRLSKNQNNDNHTHTHTCEQHNLQLAEVILDIEPGLAGLLCVTELLKMS